jgi:hypothetical protein
VLSAHEKQYGESKIYANLHEAIQKNHAHLQELINAPYPVASNIIYSK